MKNYRRKSSRAVAKPNSAPPESKTNASILSNYEVPVNSLLKDSINPAISVIIPMYNREKYIGECLDSLLAQTFQNFEVIVIDDCSTDNSVEIVESYFPKFGKRLKLIKLEKNTGHPGEPRNKGIAIAQGEYIYCLDSDDIITETAFEEMYAPGKEYNADVVYCEKYYWSEGFGQEFKNNIRIADSRIQKPPFVNKPTLDPEDLGERIQKLKCWNYWMSPALKIVKRSLLIDNNIKFPLLVGSEDDVWSLKILFSAKRFLRIPNICFIRRIHNEGISFGEYTTADHVERWMDVTIRCLKDLDNFMGRMEFFKRSPGYRYDILHRSVSGSFANIFAKCADKSAFDIYKIFQEKFGEYLGDNAAMVSSICSYVIAQQRNFSNNQKRLKEESQKRIAELETELKGVESRKPIGISVVIPMYNVQDYIGEMLDSLLYQTFEDFEVIIVDDRSTDNSFDIVNSYVPKFNGRLTLIQLEKNSGGAGEPRNVGLTFTRGEYVIFFDADDFILLSGLETLYNYAKKYDADVVYSGAYYNLPKENDIYFYRDGLGRKLIKDGLKDEPTLIIDDQKKLLDQFLLGEPEGNLSTPWTRLVRRELLIENKIKFPITPNCDDFIWDINVYSYARRFLRIASPFYFYRRHTASLSLAVREPTEQLAYWISSFVVWAKALNDLENRTEILKNNPKYCFNAVSNHFRYCRLRTKEAQQSMTSQEIYEILHREFQSKNVPYDIPLSLFFSTLDAENKIAEENSQAASRTMNFITARIDIKLVPKSGGGDFQIFSVSDNKVKILKPPWINKGGIGYVLNSYVGKLNFVAKATVEGKIQFSIKGLDVRQSNDFSKRIPYWINYTKFIVNEKSLINAVTPTWHDKPYDYNMDVKAGEEVKIQLEWVSDYNFVETKQLQASPPAISVVIPMYNTEEYIGECLDSLLIQTFQDFEVIIVDDCSTDNSVKIVNDYAPKFNKRLTLTKTKKNSGGGGYVPRNVGLKFAKGEYVIFLDSDDFLLGNALETLYKAAKKYDAEVIYSSNYYSMSSANNVYFYRDGLGRNLFKAGIEDKTELTINNLDKIFREFIAPGSGEGNFRAPWSKFVRRDYLIKNKILFPEVVTGGDSLWCIDVYAHCTRFLRFPTPLYFYRNYNTNSLTRTKRDSAEQISYWIKAFVAYLKALSDIQNRSDFLRKNPFYCYESAKGGHFRWTLNRIDEARHKLSNKDIYEILYRELGKENNSFDLMVPFFFSVIDDKEKVNEEKENLIHQFRPTARLDVNFVPKIVGSGDFQIVSMSDDEAKTTKPPWLNKVGIGYMIQSYAGILEIVFKATTDGRIRFDLKGLDIRDPKDNSKRIPFWLDYTKLIVNSKTILDKLTPAWHDKPYSYDINVKADEEVKVQVEWFPHRDEVLPKVSKPVEKPKPVATDKYLSPKPEILPATPKSVEKPKPVVTNKSLSPKPEILPDTPKPAKKFKPGPVEFLPNRTARLDLQMVSDTDEGDFKILFVSDNKAQTTKPDYLNRDGIGYVIQSHAGKMEIIAKANEDGQVTLKLKGMDIRDPKDNSKRIPQWIYYTKLTINGETIFDELTPAWHDKPYRYDMYAEANEKIKIQVEWLPHRVDILPPLPKSVEKPVAVEFLPNLTARLDLQMVSDTVEGDFKILSVSDNQSSVDKPGWLQKDGVGYVIQSSARKMEIVAKTNEDGQVTLKLKGMDIRDPKDKSKRVPYWIDYTKLTINGETIFDELTPAWHDKPYRYDIYAEADEEIKIQVEWLTHNKDT